MGAVVVDGAGDQLLASAAGALDQNGAPAFGHLRQETEDFDHPGVFADDVLEGVLPPKGLLEFFDCRDVLKGFDPADHSALGIPQQGGADIDGNSLLVGAVDMHRHIRQGAFGLDRPAQHATGFANVGAEDLETWPAKRLRPRDPGDDLGGPVEGGDAPVQIHREHPFDQAVQDQFLVALLCVIGFCFHGCQLLSFDVHKSWGNLGAFCSYFWIQSRLSSAAHAPISLLLKNSFNSNQLK